MWLTNTAIRRPVLITMFFAAIVVMGLVCFGRIPVERTPKVDLPFVSVVTLYPGAGPQEIETLVSKRIEDAVGSIANLKNVTSTSQEGVSVVALEFELGTDLATACADVREKVDSVRTQLPDDAEAPSITKADIGSLPVITLAMRGDVPPRELRRFADDVVKDRLGRVKGAASVSVNGGDVREIQVQVDRARLDAYGLSITDLANAIKAEDMNVPGGSIKRGPQEYSVRVVGEFASADELSRMRLHLKDNNGGPGSTIRLSEVAKVMDTAEDPSTIARLNGERAVLLSVQKQTDANTLDVTNGVQKEIKDLTPQLPPGAEFVVTQNDGDFVQRQLDDTMHELVLSIILVVIVVFLFLHSGRATFIVALAIPTSLIATLTPIHMCGFSLNFMTMLAMTLAVGILVDDAIVVLENIDRHLKDGEPPREAALNGRTEIGLAAVTITMVDVVVYIPIAFMGGIVGSFFRSFGITVASATLFSLLVSFTLTPMMASRFYKRETRHGHKGPQTRWQAYWDRQFAFLEAVLGAVDRGYRSLLAWSLENRWLTVVIGMVTLTTIIITLMPAFGTPAGFKARVFNLIVFVGLLGGSAFLTARDKRTALIFVALAAFVTVGVHLRVRGEMSPDVDRGNVAITIEGPVGASLKYSSAVAAEVERIVRDVPEVEFYTTTVGSKNAGAFRGSETGAQYAYVAVNLVDRARHNAWGKGPDGNRRLLLRKRSIEDVMTEIRGKIARQVAGARIIVASADAGMGGGAPIEMEVQGNDSAEISRVANQMASVMEKVPGTRDVEVSWKVGKPELKVTVDRDRAMDRNISTAEIASALRNSVEGNTDSKFRVEGTEYNIRVQVDPEDRTSAESVKRVVVGSFGGAPVYLGDVADVNLDAAPTKIDRKNRQRQVTVSTYQQPGMDLSTVQTAVNQAIANVPKGNTTVNVGGMSDVQRESFGFIFQALGLAICLVFMLMAALFESFLNPMIIMLALPQAIAGALLLLMMRGQSISIVSLIGVIMLMGLVTKNAILMIDYTNTLRARGLARRDAILQAGPTRLRPILMTTMSMIMGMMPVMFALSRGSEQRSPLATAVVGGLLVSTLLTLLVIPASYTLAEDMVKKISGLFHRRTHREVAS